MNFCLVKRTYIVYLLTVQRYTEKQILIILIKLTLMEISTLNAESWRNKLKLRLVVLPLLFFVVFNLSAQQQFEVETEAYQNAKAAGQISNDHITYEYEG